jgi:hypothetical protein
VPYRRRASRCGSSAGRSRPHGTARNVYEKKGVCLTWHAADGPDGATSVAAARLPTHSRENPARRPPPFSHWSTAGRMDAGPGHQCPHAARCLLAREVIVFSSGGMENFHIVPLPHRDTGGKRHDVGPQSDKAGMTIPGLIIISTVDAWCRNHLARPPGQDDNHRGSEPPRRAVPARDGRAPAGQAFVRWPLRQPIGNLCRSQQFFPRGVYSAGRAGFPAPQPGGRVVSQRRRVRPACSSDQPGSGRGAKR